MRLALTDTASVPGNLAAASSPGWRRLAATCALCVAIVAGLAAESVAAPCRVGLDVRTIWDGTRSYGSGARPVRIVLWYPAASAADRVTTRASLVRADWASPRHPVPGWHDWRLAASVFRAQHAQMRRATPVAQVLAEQGCAGWLAAARPGRWPLVVLGSGLASGAHLQRHLAEELADAGFAVAFVSVLGPEPGQTPGFNGATVRMLAADVLAAIRGFQDVPHVDTSRIGLVGWSASGVVHLAVGEAATDVRAVVSLDSGVGYDYGPRLWSETAVATLTRRPYLHIRAGVRGPVPTDDTLLERLGTQMGIAPGLTHAQFTDMPATDGPALAAQGALRRRVRDFLLRYIQP